MLRNDSITKISILSRRPVPQLSQSSAASQKCTVILHRDFAESPSPDVLAQLAGATGCVWALGISVNDVDKDLYRKITLDYPMVFAKAFAKAFKDRFNFVYVSGEGATTESSWWTPRFGTVKGEAESALLRLSGEEEYRNLKVYSARPGAVDDGQDPELQEALKDREIPTWKKIVEKPMFGLLRPLMPSMMSPTRELGEAMVKLATGDGEALPPGLGISGNGRTLANVALRKLVGL